MKKTTKYTYKLIILKKLLMMMKVYYKNDVEQFKMPYGDFYFDPSSGICENLRNISFELFGTEKYGKVKKYFKSWKHFSGNELYPIAPHKNYIDDVYGKVEPQTYYQLTINHYQRKHDYKSRISLLNHIIECVEYDLETEIFISEDGQ